MAVAWCAVGWKGRRLEADLPASIRTSDFILNAAEGGKQGSDVIC